MEYYQRLSTPFLPAGRLRCRPETVKRVRKLYPMRGINALHPIKPPGRTSRAAPSLLCFNRCEERIRGEYGKFNAAEVAGIARHDAVSPAAQSDDILDRILVPRSSAIRLACSITSVSMLSVSLGMDRLLYVHIHHNCTYRPGQRQACVSGREEAC